MSRPGDPHPAAAPAAPGDTVVGDPDTPRDRSVRRRALLTAVVALATAVSLVPASARPSVDEAREARERVEELLDTTAGDLEGVEERIADLDEEIASLDGRDAELRRELEQVQRDVGLRARQAFMTGGAPVLSALLTGAGPGQAAERAALLETLALRDASTVEQASALRVRLDQTRELREARVAEVELLQADLQEQVTQLVSALEQARSTERAAELLARRQREIESAFMNGIYSCPVGEPLAFRDTWGAPRSGGRSHKGVDMFAPFDTPVYAIHSGRITRLSNSGLGGISVYMYGDDNNQYYYTHLAGYVAGLRVGQRVVAGDHIAYNGDTGNARGGAPHVHFEIRPGGGRNVNPYPWVARACGRT